MTPGGEATNTVSAAIDDLTTDADETDRGQHQYFVSGLDDTMTYSLGLVSAEDVTVDSNGVASFGAPADPDLTSVTSVQGNLTFTIDSESEEQVIPVLFVDDGTDDNAIDLDADDMPTWSRWYRRAEELDPG